MHIYIYSVTYLPYEKIIFTRPQLRLTNIGSIITRGGKTPKHELILSKLHNLHKFSLSH